MPLTHDHIADVAIHATIAGVAVWQTMGWLMVAEAASYAAEFPSQARRKRRSL